MSGIPPGLIAELRDRTITRCLELLHWVYTTDSDEIDVSEDYHVPRGERRLPQYEEEQKQYLGYQLKHRGRRNPVALLSTTLVSYLDDSQQHAVFLLIELSETDLLLKQNHDIAAIIRTCSFLGHVLGERTNDEGVDLSPAIREAYKQNELNESELKLAQFIRHSRNDASHNLFYNTESGFEVHNHAALCTITLLNSLLKSWYNSEWYVDSRLSSDLCIRVIEGEFGYEWDAKNYTYDKDSLHDRYVNRG